MSESGCKRVLEELEAIEPMAHCRKINKECPKLFVILYYKSHPSNYFCHPPNNLCVTVLCSNGVALAEALGKDGAHVFGWDIEWGINYNINR